MTPHITTLVSPGRMLCVISIEDSEFDGLYIWHRTRMMGRRMKIIGDNIEEDFSYRIPDELEYVLRRSASIAFDEDVKKAIAKDIEWVQTVWPSLT